MRKSPQIRKCLAVGIILLFAGTCVIQGIAQDIEKPLSVIRGNTLYVGGSGPGNYTKIQDAINHSNDGDTVFVYDDSSPYNESIYVKKSIILQGENWETTIIQNGWFYIIVDNVTITDFTIHHGSGIYIENSSNNLIENCDFYDNWYGIDIYNDSGNNRIRNCSFHLNRGNDVRISYSEEGNEISYCDFFYNKANVEMFTLPGSIWIDGSYNTKIHHCNFTNNLCGILISRSAAQITSNNFVNNSYLYDNRYGGVTFSQPRFHYSDVRNNWWGTSQGPRINITTIWDSVVTIRKVDNSDDVVFYAFFIPKIVQILYLYPWLSEPVADAGRQT
jgi:parallel beta-helix repeat protein